MSSEGLYSKRSMSSGNLSVDGLESDNGLHQQRYRERYGSKSSLISRRLHRAPRYNQHQLKHIETFSSLNYSPTYSEVYKQWRREHQPTGVGYDRWILMILSAFLIGCLGCLISQSLQYIDRLKWEKAREWMEEYGIWVCWGWTAGFSAALALIASLLVTFVYPNAMGSGVPEVISYLNGVIVYKTMNLKNLFVKFLALVFSVGSGLPCAIQGPLISMGAIIGGGIGEFQSKSLRFHPKMFTRFRNPEDRRAFTTAGVAAGVAAGFNAPIGGLLLAMEDLATFWSRRLCWQTLFCSGVAAATANLVNAAFDGFQWNNSFGLFSLSIVEPITMGVGIFVPAIAIGVTGGILGAMFIHLNYTICRIRKKIIGAITPMWLAKVVRMVEPMLLAVGMASSIIFISDNFDCKSLTEVTNVTGAGSLPHCEFYFNESVEPFNCLGNENGTEYYSEMATLTMGMGTDTLRMLHSRNTHHWFDYKVLLVLLPIYFFGTCWTAGTAIAGGLFVPLLVTGSIYGRIAGMLVLDLLRIQTGHDVPVEEYWRWIDPGAISLLGAGALFGGVTRLTVAGTVILVEMNRDIHITIPLMVAIFTAKEVASVLSKPLYAYQLHLKTLPYLEHELNLDIDGRRVDMELYKAGDVMNIHVKSIHSVESVGSLAKLLLETEHGGFPVVRYDTESRADLVYGFITRTELSVILSSDQVRQENTHGAVVDPEIDYEQVSVDYLHNPESTKKALEMYVKHLDLYNSIYINLKRFINLSAPKVDLNYSLHRTYTLFRTLGLRHLMVVDIRNKVRGIITRKDLLPFKISEKIIDLAYIDDRTEAEGQNIALVPHTDYLSRDPLMEHDQNSNGPNGMIPILVRGTGSPNGSLVSGATSSSHRSNNSRGGLSGHRRTPRRPPRRAESPNSSNLEMNRQPSNGAFNISTNNDHHNSNTSMV